MGNIYYYNESYSVYKSKSYSTSDSVWEVDAFPVEITVVLYFTVLIGSGILGNGLVAAAFFTHRRLRAHSINVIMVHIAITNLIISIIIDPIYIFMTFTGFTKLKMTLSVALTHFGNALCLYGICALATNRYLLITRPQTTYRRLCVSGKSVAWILVWIWIAAILTELPYWVLLFYYLEYMYSGLAFTFYAKVQMTSYCSVAIWFLPVTIVPALHCATLRTIRESRRKVQSAIAVIPNVATPTDHCMVTTPTVSTCVETTTFGKVSRTPSLRIARFQSIGHGQSSATTNLGTDILGPGNLVDTCSRKTDNAQPCSNSQRKNTKAKKHPRKESELRMLKMMILMYIVLFISTLPAILSFTPVLGAGDFKHLRYFGFLVPVSPAILPHIFIWSNKNLKSAIVDVFRAVRYCDRSRLTPNQ